MCIWPPGPHHFPCGASWDVRPRVTGLGTGVDVRPHFAYVLVGANHVTGGGVWAEETQTPPRPKGSTSAYSGRAGTRGQRCGSPAVILPGTCVLIPPKWAEEIYCLICQLPKVWLGCFPHECAQLAYTYISPSLRAHRRVWEGAHHSGKAASGAPLPPWVPWGSCHWNHPARLHVFYSDLRSVSWLCLGLCVWANFPGGSVVKNLPANAEDTRNVDSISGWERSPGGGHGKPLQYSCLENPMDRGTWKALSPRGPKELTWLSIWARTRTWLWGLGAAGWKAVGQAELPAATPGPECSPLPLPDPPFFSLPQPDVGEEAGNSSVQTWSLFPVHLSCFLVPFGPMDVELTLKMILPLLPHHPFSPSQESLLPLSVCTATEIPDIHLTLASFPRHSPFLPSLSHLPFHFPDYFLFGSFCCSPTASRKPLAAMRLSYPSHLWTPGAPKTWTMSTRSALAAAAFANSVSLPPPQPPQGL